MLCWALLENGRTREDEHFRKMIAFGKSLLAGGIAGAVSRSVVSPLERLKIIFQLHTDNSQSGIIRSLRKMHEEEGVLGFFRGNGTNIVRIIPYSAVQFATYETVKRLLIGDRKELESSPLVKLFSGASAGIASVTVTYPLDLVRTRLSLPGETPRGIIACMHQVYVREGGVVALYRGLVPTIAGIAPYVALNFTTYETLKGIMSKRRGLGPEEELPVYVRLACGGLAGAVAQACTFPLDVIRRRMQVSKMNCKIDKMSNKIDKIDIVQGPWALALDMWRREGWRAFYRGMLPNLLKVVPAISTSFVMFEWSKKVLNKLFP